MNINKKSKKENYFSFYPKIKLVFFICIVITSKKKKDFFLYKI